MKLRSPLGRVRGLGSAKSGLHHWWHQRLTALALVPLSLWFVNAILAHMDDSHAEVVNWIASPFVSAMLIALILSLFYHAKLGLQVVIEDYLHDELQKMVALVVMKFAVAFGALLGVVAVLKISLGMA
jgi:succinate dehydrogenase / fumarate reductase membrane anchor subunit